MWNKCWGEESGFLFTREETSLHLLPLSSDVSLPQPNRSFDSGIANYNVFCTQFFYRHNTVAILLKDSLSPLQEACCNRTHSTPLLALSTPSPKSSWHIQDGLRTVSLCSTSSRSALCSEDTSYVKRVVQLIYCEDSRGANTTFLTCVSVLGK